jgi:hypothetical protein
VQQDAIERALRSIVRAISENTIGRNEGPWASAMVDSCARNTAQLLLGLAAGFKRSAYAGEREWRIVCAPRLGSNSSAPSALDEDFSINIKRAPRAHVSLQIAQPLRLFEPVMIPPVPFVDWASNPVHFDQSAVERINATLRSHGRRDLVKDAGLLKAQRTDLRRRPCHEEWWAPPGPSVSHRASAKCWLRSHASKERAKHSALVDLHFVGIPVGMLPRLLGPMARSTPVFQASINSGACRQQHRLQCEQNLLFYAIPGKKLQSVYISPSVPHECADPHRPPVERRRVLNLHFAIDCQLDRCEDGPAIVAHIP